MTSGFLFLKNGKIRYINQSMLEKCLRNKEIFNIVRNSEYNSNDKNSNNYNKTLISDRDSNNLIKIFGLEKKIKTEELMGIINKQENSEKIMDILLSDIDCDSIDFDNSPYHLKTVTKFNPNKIEELKRGFSSKIFFEEFKKRFYNESINRFEVNKSAGGAYMDVVEDCQTFVLLGFKNLEVEIVTDEGEVKKEMLNYEVHCRYYSNKSNKKTENIEFIFKDITRTKIIEEKNAEFKLKSLFLSKVAHEFKNPLICITELIDQVYDELDNGQINILSNHKAKLFENLVNNNMPLIKALSNYMIILVKDLDFFSQSQTEKKTKTLIREVELKEILNFSSEIAKGLIKKSNKHDDVEIILEKTSNVPKVIYTDETKLKQILINLQSNSVKFTFKGYIKLSVQKDEMEGWLKFEVSDTGPGMNEEVKSNLFKPFQKSHNKENSAGAGLGLSIVKEMVSNLGGEINYKSQIGFGSSFWFSIPVHNNVNLEISQSINSVNSPINSGSHKLKHLSNASVNKSIKSIVSKDTVVIDMNNFVLVKHSDIVLEDTNEVLAIESDKNYETSSENLISENRKIKIEKIKLSSHFKNLSNHDNSSDKNNSYNNCIVKKQNIEQEVDKKENVFFENCLVENSIITEEHEDFIHKIKKESSKVMKMKVLNFIVADDEHLARQSTIRNLNKAALKLNKQINIVESSDGIETLNLVYNSISKGEIISGIITDENMKILKGSSFIEILFKFFEIKIDIPIFLVSAYEDKNIIKNAKLFKEIYAKPLNLFNAEQIINHTEQANLKK
jgi:signal transduction histidine kinase